MSTPTVQPFRVLSACGCNGYSLGKIALVECCHMVVGRELMLSFLTESSVWRSSVVEPGECVRCCRDTVASIAVLCSLSNRLTPVMIWCAVVANEFIRWISLINEPRVAVIKQRWYNQTVKQSEFHGDINWSRFDIKQGQLPFSYILPVVTVEEHCDYMMRTQIVSEHH